MGWLTKTLQLSAEQGFDYVLKRQKRKTLALHVLPDASVEVRAPRWLPNYEIVNFVERRADWIIKQRHKQLQKVQQQPRFDSGQYHPFLGQRYPLHCQQSHRHSVELCDSVLVINVREPENREQVQRALEKWYRQQAIGLFEERLFACFERFPEWFQHKYAMPTIIIRKMRRRWGSCSSRGDVTLNLELIKKPLPCIDYVIVHELCHLEVFNHSPHFYRLLAQVLPDWRELELLIESADGKSVQGNQFRE